MADAPKTAPILTPPLAERSTQGIEDYLTTPIDGARERVISPGATHIVTGDAVGLWCRGDKIGPNDLPTGDDGIARLVKLGVIRELTKDEAKDVPPAKPAKAPVIPLNLPPK